MIEQVQRFFTVNVGCRAPGTERLYARHLIAVSEWLETKSVSDPSQVTTDLLLEWLNGHDDWGLSSRRNALNALRVFFRWAVSNSPAMEIPFPRRPTNSSRRALDPQEALEMLAVPDTSTVKGTRDLAILSLMMDTGLRASEVCNSLLDKLKLRECTLQVFVKGERWDWAIFSEHTMRALEAWIVARGGVARPKERHIFVSLGGPRKGTQLGPRGLRVIVNGISATAGVGHICPHELRHSFAELALRAGAPTRVLQRAGRWRDLKQVELYTHRIELEAFRDYFPMSYLMEDGFKK